MDLITREMTIEDYEEVIELWKSSDGVGVSEADSRLSFANHIERHPGLNFVALSDDSIIGAVLCGHDGSRGYIHHLAVRPDFQGKSLGRNLAAMCQRALKQIGINRCHLFVFGTNSGSIKFWEKTGWTERKDLIVMSKTIS